jgi:hypothetical protein
MSAALTANLLAFKYNLERYSPSDERDAAARDRILRLLDLHGAEMLKRDCFTPGHLTCSVMIINPEGTHVLANYHGKCAVYMHFGGHWERFGETPFQTAMREACEEVFNHDADGPIPDIEAFGFRSPMGESLFDMSVGFVPERLGDPRHLHCDLRFVFTLPLETSLVGSAESDHVRWMTWKEAEQEWTRDPDIDSFRFLQKVQTWCKPNPSPSASF